MPPTDSIDESMQPPARRRRLSRGGLAEAATVFVDETKSRGYVLVAAAVSPSDVDLVRKALRNLVLPGQRRLHMKNESDSRRREIVTAIAGTGCVMATVYDAGRRYKAERERRAACLTALVGDSAARGDAMLVIEQDDTLLSFDRQHLVECTRAAGCRDTLRYEHRKGSAEVMLALPDAIAWCWAKGGDWRRRVGPLVVERRMV